MKAFARYYAATAALACLVASPGHSEANLLSLRGQVQAGGASGKGIDGTLQDQAFSQQVSGLTYGALVGVRITILDAWVEHNQYIDDGTDFLGTWTQFMVGLGFEVGLGDRKGGTIRDGRRRGGYRAGYAEIGLAAGFGVGTLQQVEPPLDNAQVNDKGFVGQLTLGAGYRLNQVFSLGVTVPLQVGYMFKNGVPANVEGNQYASAQAAALLNLRMTFNIK